MSRLAIDDVSVKLGQRTILDHAALTLAAGELVGLIGPNGAGKSTLVKAIAQLLPYRGHIQLDGYDLARLPPKQRATQLAYLGQGDGMHWPITVEDLVALGRYPYRGGWRYRHQPDRASEQQAIEAALHSTDLQALRTRRIDQLSGGERARARLARVLAVQAPVLLADEPVASLDPRHQLKVMSLLRWHCREGAAAIVVLHDLTLASRFCDRLMLLDEGRQVALGPVKQVLTPRNLQTVYGIKAVLGEHQQQTYAVPWICCAE